MKNPMTVPHGMIKCSTRIAIRDRMIQKLKSGHYRVRVDTRRTIDTPEDAKRLDGLIEQAVDKALREFEQGSNPCPTILESLDDFLAHQEALRSNKPRTLAAHNRRLKRFAAELSNGKGDISVDMIRREAVVEWICRRLSEKGHKGKYNPSHQVSKTTINNDIKTLKQYALWCVDRNYTSGAVDVLTVPMLRIQGKIKDRFPPEILPRYVFRNIVSRIRKEAPHIEIVLRGMLLLGARPEALFRMKWADVVLPTNIMPGRISLQALKDGMPANIPVAPGSAKEMLLKEARTIYKRFHGRWPGKTRPVFPTVRGRSKRRPGGWTTDIFDRAVHSVCERLGLERRFVPYFVRHFAITYLATSGLSTAEVQHYAGHMRAATQEPYRHTSSEVAAPALAAMEEFVNGGEKCAHFDGDDNQENNSEVETPLLFIETRAKVPLGR